MYPRKLFHCHNGYTAFNPSTRPSNSKAATTSLNAFSSITEKMTGIVELISGQTTITEANIEATLQEIKSILIDADVNLQVTNSIVKKVKEKAIGMKVQSGTKPGTN